LNVGPTSRISRLRGVPAADPRGVVGAAKRVVDGRGGDDAWHVGAADVRVHHGELGHEAAQHTNRVVGHGGLRVALQKAEHRRHRQRKLERRQ